MNLKITQATSKGYIEVKPYGAFDWSYPDSLTRRGRVQGDATSHPPSCAKTKYMCMKESKNDWRTIVGSKQANAFRGHIDGISPCMTEAMGMGGGQIPLLTNATIEESQTEYFMKQMRGHDQNAIELPSELKGKKFRIRKLTPKECFRLMGVDDKDIDKIQAAGVSNSGQYKLAGNSIVVDTLFHLFRKLLIEPENESGQLSLF